MSKRQQVKALPEQVYKADKILRVEPQRLQCLGLYTIRLMLPPGAKFYAVETPTAVHSAERIDEDTWHINFTMYAADNSGEIDDVLGLFSDDGYMFLENTGKSRFEQFGARFLMGYLIGTVEKNSLELGSLIDLDIDPSPLFAV